MNINHINAAEVTKELSKPFPVNAIKWRIGSTSQDKKKGLALAYIDARHVMDRLDSVVGPENWQDKYDVYGPRIICSLSLRIEGEWITKADGAGDTHVEAEKGGISDALKRAAVKWGIGRYLYNLGNVWVECEPSGKSARIKQGQEHLLFAALERVQPINWAEERDELTRLLSGCKNLEAVLDLWRTKRMQNFIKKAPAEFSSPVLKIKDTRKAEETNSEAA